jgi:hypothetical protein
MSTVIGSYAIKEHFPNFREPKDLDIAVESKSFISSARNIEFLYNPIIAKIKDEIAPPEIILALKVSHLFWDINWDKHMWDVQFLLDKGITYDPKLCKKLYNFWQGMHRKRKIAFKKTKKDFFRNMINYDKEEHDYIHTLINPKPLYLDILKGEVQIDPDKFNKLSYENKFDLFKEEIYVMAYERYRHLSFKKAQHRMVKHYITNNAPFNGGMFVINNYKNYIRLNFDFIKHINSKK